MNLKERANELSQEIIGAAIEVHSALGPGLLESAYLTSLCHELNLRGVKFAKEVALPVKYKDATLDAGYRLDLLVDKQVIVEVKTVERIQPIHQAQLLTYLKLTNLWLGILLNFNVLFLKQGIRRVVNG
ncbi:MAG: GxxExxY protein [Anaerolineales bacterium]|nr:GxxExxY protein [Anaerolineales bacterium]